MMQFIYTAVFIIAFTLTNCTSFDNQNSIVSDEIVLEDNSLKENKYVLKLLKYYPQIVGFQDNRLIFQDSTRIVFDDSIYNKSNSEMLNNPSVKDMFHFEYPANAKIDTHISKNFNPGRIRNEHFFKKIYGMNREEVERNLTEIIWCPKLVGKKILVSKVNGVDEAFKRVSEELDQMPEYKEFFSNIGGTYYWRKISGTNRLSAHSFGIAIDLNVSKSNYWQWDCKCTNEDAGLTYKNKFPLEIVKVFEKHGFIWGGRWYHYDTMHFEYRPELVL